MKLALPVFVRGEDGMGEPFSDLTETTDVSQCGMGITMRRFTEPSSIVTVEIAFPAGTPSGVLPATYSKGMVVRVENRKPLYVWGIDFEAPLT